MYKKILIPLENSEYDTIILDHVRGLAKLCGSELVLIHVADGYAARLKEELNLEDSEEIKKDRAYLYSRREELKKDGFKTEAVLENGEPSDKILSVARQENCDLIAMTTHGHRFIKDVILGSVADDLRHRTSIPILMIRAKKP